MGLFRKKTDSAAQEPRIIGTAGAGRGTGTTHFTVLAANYLCSGCGRKTAVLEWNRHGDFARFGSACTGLSAVESRYRIQGVDFYPDSAGGILADCLHMDYEEILVDFGELEEKVCEELLRCHRVFLTVSFTEWQTGAFWKPESWEERAAKNGWQCLAAFGSEESRLRWNKRRRPAVRRIPFSVDAFTVTGPMMEFMRTIL